MRNYNTARTYFETVLCNHPTEDCEIVPTLKDIRITASYEDENYIGFDGISTSKEGGCKHCGQYISMIKDYKSSCTTIGKYNSKNVILRLVKTMYYCSDCQASTTERLLDVTGNQQKTDGFLKSMIGSLKETVTYSTIARMYKVSVSNVILHFDKAELRENQVDPRSVRNLAIDEVRFIKLKNANYQCVLMDADSRKVIAILETRQQNIVKEHLSKMFTRLDTITQDLWNPYRSIGRSCFPEAKIIADPFHVVRQFMWAFSRTRIALAKEQGLQTNKNWKLLTKRYSKLDERGQKKVTALLEVNPQLMAAHTAKELALEMFSCKDKALYVELLKIFKDFIDENNLVEFQTAYKSAMNWHGEILNMLESSYSNGAIERTNRVIKQSKNIAFGFLNLFRATKLVQYRMN